MKSYRGNLPEIGEGWRRIGSCSDADKIEWCVYAKPQQHSSDWMTIKIAANGYATQKANNWVVMNIRTGQIGYARDFATMREHRPDLHAKIEELFSEFKGLQDDGSPEGQKVASSEVRKRRGRTVTLSLLRGVTSVTGAS